MSEILFAGCAAHSMAGRSSQVSKFDGVDEQNVYTFSRLLPKVSIARVVAGSTASHYFLLSEEGKAFAWGRNEDFQVSGSRGAWEMLVDTRTCVSWV